VPMSSFAPGKRGSSAERYPQADFPAGDRFMKT
jgi:hypothetical protein